MRSRQGAFTLVELIAALVVAGVLAALAVGTFGSVHQEAARGSARGLLDRVVLLERTWAATNGGYSVDALEELRNQDTWTSRASGGPTEASVAVADDGSLGVAVLSGDGQCVAAKVADQLDGGALVEVDLDPRGCSALSALALG